MNQYLTELNRRLKARRPKGHHPFSIAEYISVWALYNIHTPAEVQYYLETTEQKPSKGWSAKTRAQWSIFERNLQEVLIEMKALI